jgi:predicted O-methyltransferase YrrM
MKMIFHTSQNSISAVMKQMFDHVQKASAGMYEGGASLAQVEWLRNLARKTQATRIAEIGFNVGFSSIGFLESAPEVQLVSFELDLRPCVRAAKEFIEDNYPGRHELIVGDSRDTLPEYAASGQADLFDLVFVDGGHEYDVSISDIRNSHSMARSGALVIVDDLTPWYPWGVGPTRAWGESVESGLIEPLEYVADGLLVEHIEGPADRAWAAGIFR